MPLLPLTLVLLSLELIDFKTRRVSAFRKNLVELAELELKHAKVREQKGFRRCRSPTLPLTLACAAAGEPPAAAELPGRPERKHITCRRGRT